MIFMNILEGVLEAINPVLMAHIFGDLLPEPVLEPMQILSIHLDLHEHLIKHPQATLQIQDFIITDVLVLHESDSFLQQQNLSFF